jgi:putative membrane protein
VPIIFLLISFYLVLVGISIHQHKRWSIYRVLLWVVGIFCAMGAVTGPIANQGHNNFTMHMVGHLLLGMLAPLLLVLAAPMTLLLRTLHVIPARFIARLLKSTPLFLISSPLVASLLNIGGLWLIYTSNLFEMMQHNLIIHLIVHFHIFLAGFVFTAAFIYIDPRPHRTSFFHRAIVLIFAFTGHNILSKYIYAHPPDGVSIEQGKTGGMLMYYGGDAIDLIFIIIFCFQWYNASLPKGFNLSRASKKNQHITKTLHR